MLHLRFALRTLFKAPFVTVVAILSLALGIGANAAIFSMFNEVLLRRLPVAEPEALVNLLAPGPKPGNQSSNQAGGSESTFSYPMFRDLERAQTAFTGMAAHRVFGANVAARGSTATGEGMMVSGGYFGLLGIQPALGRLIGPGDDRVPGESRVAVLSHAFWEARFGGDPDVLSQPLVVNGQPLTIVGVAPRGFSGTTLGALPHVFVPITLREQMQPGITSTTFENRRNYWMYVFARLKPGFSIEQAHQAINVPYRAILDDVEAPLQEGMSDQTMARFRAREVGLEPGAHGQTRISQEATAPLTLLLGVTALVLLIACANIANLLLARSAARAGEMAIRLSIGASRWQLVRQLLLESCLLALFGGIGGVVVARWTLDAVVSLLPADAVRTMQFDMDGTALMFAAALSVGTGLLFGLFPALHSTRPDLVSSLKGQAGQPSGARNAARFRTTLATAQIALSMALLIAAGLFTKSLFNVARVDLGLEVDDVITFGVSPPLNGYSPEQTLQFFERLEDALAAVPGVKDVSSAVVPLLAGSNSTNSIRVQGFEAGPDTDTGASYNWVGPNYFRTAGIRLLAGREFTRNDAAKTAKVAVVNAAFARKFNLGGEAVGKYMRESGSTGPLDVQIVGLIEDAKYSQVKDVVPPQYFRPYRQMSATRGMAFYVRTSADPVALLAAVPALVARLDPNLPIDDARTMPQQIRENVFLDRFLSVLSAAFASLATLLAAIGLYGVLAYTVSQRTREIGLRMALGAAPGRVRAMVLRQVGVMTAVGGTAGLASALALGRLAQSMLYEMGGSDPAVMAGAVATLAAVAFGAGFIPAHRASRVDPMRALRYE
jgi:predicted permease